MRPYTTISTLLYTYAPYTTISILLYTYVSSYYYISKSMQNASFIRKSMRYYVAIFKGLPAGRENTLRAPAGKVLLHPGEHFLGQHRASN